MKTLPNLWFIIANAILTGYLTFILTKGGLTDNRFSNFWRRLTKRGKVVLFLLFLILLTLITQEINNDCIRKNEESLLKKERKERDSIITNGIKLGVDSNRKKLFEDLSKAFAKQELTIDTVKKSIEVIRDSVKLVVNNYSTGDPVLMIDKNGIDRDTKIEGSYNLHIKSVEQGSTNFNIDGYVFIQFENGSQDLTKINFFPKGLKLAKNAVWNTGFGSSLNLSIRFIYLYMVGSYSNLDATKKYYIDDIYRYSTNLSTVDILGNSERRKILEIIKKISINNLILKD